ncbi:MAG: hypothetical protein ACRDTJ_22925, partial [Pseudonocardiaceae bacterium]
FFDGHGTRWRRVDYDLIDGHLWRWITADHTYPDDSRRWAINEAVRSTGSAPDAGEILASVRRVGSAAGGLAAECCR